MDGFIQNVHVLMKNVEVIIRGGNQVELGPIEALAQELFDWISSDVPKGLLDSVTEATKNDYAALAVKLHNKSRNLPTSTAKTVKTLLKSTSAFMINLFNKTTPKSVCITIKLLSSAVSDFEKSERSLKCCKLICDIWEANNLESLSRILPTLELQDIKSCVFKSYLTYVENLIILRTSDCFEQSRILLSKASHLSQTLPNGLKLSLADFSMKLGLKIASVPLLMNDAKIFFLTTIGALELISTSPEFGEEKLTTSQEEIRILKVKAQLALAYIFMETNQSEKALECIRSAEMSILSNQPEWIVTILYAKFSIYSKIRDWESAENVLRQLLKLDITYEMALETVRTFTEGCAGVYRSKEPDGDYYRNLVSKYPDEPEFSTTRLHHLMTEIANLRPTEVIEGEGGETMIQEDLTRFKKVFTMAKLIISDHLANTRPLIRVNMERLKKLIIERIAWSRSQKNFFQVVEWCDLLLSFNPEPMSPEEIEERAGYLLYKIDALLNLGKIDEGYELSKQLSNQVTSTRTIIMTFRASILYSENHKLPVSDSVNLLINLNKKVKLEASSITRMEDLSRILICFQLATEIPVQNQSLLNFLLLKEWVSQFVSKLAWKYELSQELMEYSFFKVVGLCCQFFLKHFLSSRKKASPISDSSLVESVAMNTDLKSSDESDGDHTDVPNNRVSGELTPEEVTFPISSQKLFESFQPEFRSDSEEIYYFSCDLSVIRKHLVPLIDDLSKVIEGVLNDRQPLSILGKTEELSWLADIVWNFATLVGRIDLCKLESSESKEQSRSSDFLFCDVPRLTLSATLLDYAATLYSHHSQLIDDRCSAIRNEAMCLLTSAALRIDVESADQGSSSTKFDEDIRHLNMEETSMMTLTRNLKLAESNLQSAECKLRSLLGFKDHELIDSLIKLCLTLEFAVKCKTSTRSTSLEQYVESRQSDLLSLPYEDLMRCVDLTMNERGGTLNVTRKMLRLALQVVSKEVPPNYKQLGYLHCKLMEFSPTRAQALDVLEDFCQLIQIAPQDETQRPSSPSNISSPFFELDDIDHISALAYNNAVTLLELGQTNLAERFLEKSMFLLQWASPSLRENWQCRMQDTFDHLVTMKSKTKESQLLLSAATSISSSFSSSDSASLEEKSSGEDRHREKEKELMISFEALNKEN